MRGVCLRVLVVPLGLSLTAAVQPTHAHVLDHLSVTAKELAEPGRTTPLWSAKELAEPGRTTPLWSAWEALDVDNAVSRGIGVNAVVIITARFYPLSVGLLPARPLLDNCGFPPHPLGRSHQVVFTNRNASLYPEEACWQHVVISDGDEGSLPCTSANDCCMAAKPAKAPLAAQSRKYMAVLGAYDYVLYLDDEVSFTGPDVLRRLLDTVLSKVPPTDDWTVMLREHRMGRLSVDDEYDAAMKQERYRSAAQRITQFMNSSENVAINRTGLVHNTGLMLWNMRSPLTAALQEEWLTATLSTSCECQITFYYMYHKSYEDSIITIPFSQQGILRYGVPTENTATLISKSDNGSSKEGVSLLSLAADSTTPSGVFRLPDTIPTSVTCTVIVARYESSKEEMLELQSRFPARCDIVVYDRTPQAPCDTGVIPPEMLCKPMSNDGHDWNTAWLQYVLDFYHNLTDLLIFSPPLNSKHDRLTQLASTCWETGFGTRSDAADFCCVTAHSVQSDDRVNYPLGNFAERVDSTMTYYESYGVQDIPQSTYTPFGVWIDHYLKLSENEMQNGERCAWSTFGTTAANVRTRPRNDYEELAKAFIGQQQVQEDAFFMEWSEHATFGYLELQKRTQQRAYQDQLPLSFVHIPKTAGSTIEDVGKAHSILWGINVPAATWRSSEWRNSDWLFSDTPWQSRPCSAWHIPPVSYDATLGLNPYKDKETFCIVRNPFSRIISQAVFDHSDEPDAALETICTPADINRRINVALDRMQPFLTTYDRWNGRLAAEDPLIFQDCHWLPQVAYVYGSGHERTCKHVLYLESLEADWERLFKDRPDSIPYEEVAETHATNTACPNITADDLSYDLRERIADLYYLDFEWFGYSTSWPPPRGHPPTPKVM